MSSGSFYYALSVRASARNKQIVGKMIIIPIGLNEFAM